MRGIPSNYTDLEVAAMLEHTFKTPTPFMQEIIRRFIRLAELELKEKDNEDENEDRPSTSYSASCTVCGTKFKATIESEVFRLEEE